MKEFEGLSQRQLAEAKGCSLTTVQNWMRQGCPAKKKAGKWVFSLPEIEKWLTDRDKGESGSLEYKRARLAKEQADKYSLENAQKRGELVPIGDVVKVWEGRIGGCRSRLLGLPDRIAPHVVACSNIAEVRVLLERYIHECLDELATGSGVHVPDADVEVPAAPETIGMGGSVPKVVGREQRGAGAVALQQG